MIDLHTHTLLSDGGLLPSELVHRAKEIGYEAICLSDHADGSILDFVVLRTIEVSKRLSLIEGIEVIPGVELTHIPPILIPEMVEHSRRLGAKLILLHGETLVEPVAKGTNLAGLRCKIDILAHPGLLTLEEAILAKERGIYLEITTRKGHSLTNGHVVKVAKETGALLVLNTDAHEPEDLTSQEIASKIAQGAGLEASEFEGLLTNSKNLIKRVMGQ
ncbi:TPA: PHP domain-containing protein [bacterium]|nr:PHP domain-containing protein [bacterium]